MVSTSKRNNTDPAIKKAPRLSYGVKGRKSTCNKKRIRHIAEPHIEKRRVNGRLYYVYRHGIDPPIYLGTAEYLLKAVKGEKEK